MVQNGKVGYIDISGKPLTKIIYDDVGLFSEGLAVVCLKQNCGYIDITGKEIIKTKYDVATSFSGGKADVWLDGKDLQIDKAGKIIQ